MQKGNPWDDAFEQLAELGKSTARHTVKSVKQTFDPRKMVENALGKSNPEEKMQREMNEAKEKKQNMTPLDFEKLQKKYMDQDKSKTDALRNRLFQMVKSGEEKTLQGQKQKEEEKKRQEAYQEQEKKKREREKQRQAQMEVTPQGKERKNILAPKKKKGVQPSPAEIKPSTGKQ